MGCNHQKHKSDISIEELAKSLYWLYIYRCEKSDDFGIYQVCTIAMSVYKANLNDYKELGKRKYIINPDNKELSRAEKVKALGRARRKARDKYILGNYDASKSVKENAKDLGVAEGTVRNSFKDNAVKSSKQEKYERFIVIYNQNPNASIRTLAKLTGLSDKTIQAYKKRLKKELAEGF